MSVIYNLSWLWSMSVCGNVGVYVSLWVLLLVCVGDFFFLDTFLVLSKHIVFEWLPVIASLELCLLPDHAAAVAFPSLSYPLSFSSNLCQLYFSACFSSLYVSYFLLLFQSVYPSRKVILGSWGLVFLWSVYSFFFFFIQCLPEAIQPWNNLCRCSWNFCLACLLLPFVRRETSRSWGSAEHGWTSPSE